MTLGKERDDVNLRVQVEDMKVYLHYLTIYSLEYKRFVLIDITFLSGLLVIFQGLPLFQGKRFSKRIGMLESKLFF